jgi:hypothetical protein
MILKPPAGQHTIAGVVGWCLAQAGMNAMQAGITASIPDRVPVSQRGAVSAWVMLPSGEELDGAGPVQAEGALQGHVQELERF